MIEQDVSSRVAPGVIELQREVLLSGHPLRVRLYGMSMFPFIRNGDVALVRPAEWTGLRRGDVIFYERESRLVAHRVMVAAADSASPIITKGDTLRTFDPPVRAPQLLGQVVALERGGRTIFLAGARERWIQRAAAEISGPYSRLFWRAASLRRRIVHRLLRFRAFRAARRRRAPAGATARRYVPDDLDRLANCLWDLEPGLPFARVRDDVDRQVAALEDAGATVWVMETDRRIVGAAIVSDPAPGRDSILIDAYMHLLARGCGLGGILLDTVERHAAAHGASGIVALVPDRAAVARALLRSRGWAICEVGEPTSSFARLAFRPAEAGGASLWRRPLGAPAREEPCNRS